jgi:pyruvate-formate lyase-activating enzyme
MAVADVIGLVRAAAAAGFGKAVITGGEPLAHPQRDALLDALAALRLAVKPMHIVLRTNLAAPLSEPLLARLGAAADLAVVSVDGDEAAHDARRGAGAYARTVANLRRLCHFLDQTFEAHPLSPGTGRSIAQERWRRFCGVVGPLAAGVVVSWVCVACLGQSTWPQG